MLWAPARYPKDAARAARKTLGASARAAAILRTVIGRGLLALSDALPMLGVLRSTACQDRANNWEFNGEPALKLQL